ncbi:MAG: exo-alpha-sialidase, partial [bacterium]|nr:exo-alpha-sialidase [bacterium]
AMGVYLATSTDNGITFGNDQLVVPHSTDPATYPAISAYGDTLALGYIGNIDDHYGSLVLARLSNDAGATWTEPLVVSDTDVNRPSIGPVAVSTTDEGVCLLWVDDRGGHATGDDIYTDCYYFPSEETEENCGDYNEDGMVNIDDLLEKIKELKEWIKECWLPNLGK